MNEPSLFDSVSSEDNAPAQTPTLELVDIHHSYHKAGEVLQILKGASLKLMPGEIVALTAPSGTGKSTLLHITGLLEKPDAGEISVVGQKTSGLNDKQRTALRRNEIGFVYQFHHLLPEFSARDNIAIPQMINGTPGKTARRQANELLDYFRLSQRASHIPSELSGGEQQRIAIARAVANAPALLLADEPTGNLDPTTSGYIFSALQDLVRQSGLSALIATHNFDLAARMDRQLTLKDGQIISA